jgi:voltage-gated potassium channel
MASERKDPGGKRVARIERVTGVPMLVLALVYIAALVFEYLPEASADLHQGARVVSDVVVALFAAELLVRVAVAERRLQYLASHWLDVLIVAVPFLRPLRIIMFLPILARSAVGLRRVMGRSRGTYVLLIAITTVLAAAGLMLVFETQADGSIQTFPDALWWAITTITTVGYGDAYPVTNEGRIVAAALMVVGIALFGVLTAGVAAYFVESSAEEGDKSDKLDEILARLQGVEKELRDLKRRSNEKDDT